MHANNTPALVINCLAGDLCADPSEVIEVIKYGDLVELFRSTVKDFQNYQTLLSKVSEIC